MTVLAMHELAVTEGVLEVAIAAARQAGARRIAAIDLVIGDLSGIADESVRLYAGLLGRGTPADGAELRFQRDAATLPCRDCGYSGQAKVPLQPVCPDCGSIRL